MLGEKITGYEPVLERANFKSLIEEVVKILQQRSPKWISNLDSLKQKLEMVITGILEQKIVDATEVKGFLVGQEATLKEQLTSAAQINHGTLEDLLRLVKIFKEMNIGDEFIENFGLRAFNGETQRVLDNIQKSFKRQFH